MTSKRIKLARRAQWRCMWCDQSMREELGFQNSATVEHIVPASMGGPTHMHNMGSACMRCNQMRGTQDADSFKHMAASLEPDRRLTEEAARAEARIKRKLILEGHLAPASIQPTKLRERADKQASREAYVANPDQNPFEPHSRCHRMFEKLREKGGDWWCAKQMDSIKSVASIDRLEEIS
jgi:hypothetical protein